MSPQGSNDTGDHLDLCVMSLKPILYTGHITDKQPHLSVEVPPWEGNTGANSKTGEDEISKKCNNTQAKKEKKC